MEPAVSFVNTVRALDFRKIWNFFRLSERLFGSQVWLYSISRNFLICISQSSRHHHAMHIRESQSGVAQRFRFSGILFREDKETVTSSSKGRNARSGTPWWRHYHPSQHIHLPGKTSSHTRWRASLGAPMWEPEISLFICSLFVNPNSVFPSWFFLGSVLL